MRILFSSLIIVIILFIAPVETSAVLQNFLLDLDTFADTGANPDGRIYSTVERIMIVDTFNDKFAESPNVAYVLIDSGGGAFLSTAFFNASLGSTSIDFQNRSKFDTATIHDSKTLDVAEIPLGTAAATGLRHDGRRLRF